MAREGRKKQKRSEFIHKLKGLPRRYFVDAMGAMALYVCDESVANFQPMNVNFGLIPALGYRVKGKRNKNAELSKRALELLDGLNKE